MSRRIWEITFDEVRQQLDKGINGVVIPFGIVEPHGPHLRMGTDSLLALGISEKIAERFNWLIAAPVNYGINNTLATYPGSGSIDEPTYQNFASQIIESFLRVGFKYVVVNNGHGPNHNPLENAVKKLSLNYPDARIFIIEWWHMDGAAREKVYEGKGAGHGGIDETAAAIYFFPTLVKKDKFDMKATMIWTEGIRTYPSAASCLLPDNASAPDFDDDKAKNFMDILLETVFERIQSALEGFEYNLGGVVKNVP